MDSYQGDATDAPEVTIKATVSLEPVASPNVWSLQLSAIKVEGEGKKTEILKESDHLYVQFTNDGTEFYIPAPKPLEHKHSKEGSFSNILKSVAHLFQSNTAHLGSCSVQEEEKGEGEGSIIKTNCAVDKELNKHSNHPLGIVANIQRQVNFRVSAKNIPEEINSYDQISYHLAGNKETKSRVESSLRLKLTGMGTKSGSDATAKDFLKSLKKVERNLLESPRCDESHCSKVSGIILKSPTSH